jgi:hypothetical protein
MGSSVGRVGGQVAVLAFDLSRVCNPGSEAAGTLHVSRNAVWEVKNTELSCCMGSSGGCAGSSGVHVAVLGVASVMCVAPNVVVHQQLKFHATPVIVGSWGAAWFLVSFAISVPQLKIL